MTILPLDPADAASPEALRRFLEDCRKAAEKSGGARLVSITIEVDALDPLAVLEAIFAPGEPHFYAERPDMEVAIAGAEVALEHETSGPDRFGALQRWTETVLDGAIAVGAAGAPLGGPHFFTTFAFSDTVGRGEPFPPARAFVPQWQVARVGAVTTAVANLVVSPGVEIAPLAERVWRAHEKFRRFEYAAAGVGGRAQGRSYVTRPVAHASQASARYREGVARALEAIAAGKIQKVVLARAEDVVAESPLHPLELLNGLRQKFPNCYSFSVANGRGQSFIGASPERLLRVSRGFIETEALAGSIRRGVGASEDAALAAALRRSEKDVREHALVRDAIVERMTRLGLKPEYANEPALRRLANVQHLHTAIRGVLGNHVRILQLLSALHPTPAVAGLPQEAALATIARLEDFPRGLYAGALGWLNSRGGGEFFVGLRSALVDGNRARLYAGAGIVAGSSPEEEFAETALKLEAMRGAFFG